MRHNKIVLVNAHRKSGDYVHNNPTEHLGLAYLTAYLRREGYSNVEIIDGYALGMSTEAIFEELRQSRPELVGVTFEYNTFGEAARLAAMIKPALPDTRIVFGGEHATYAGETILKDNKEVDFIVRGEGEVTLFELCEHLFADGKPIGEIAGVAYRDGPFLEPKHNCDRSAIEDINTLPFPVRDTLERALREGRRPAISILGSRGCPAKCSFCNAYKFFNIGGGARWRPRTPENIVDEMEHLLATYGHRELYPVVYFADENFVGPRRTGLDRARRFAELLLEREVPVEYEIFCRTDSFNDQDELVALLRKSGLISVLMGIEAGSDEQLKTLRKGSNSTKNYSSVQIFQDHNVVTSSSGFLMFNPYSTFRDLRRNAKFLLTIGHSTLYNMSCRIHAYPGIDMNKDLESSNMLKPDFRHYRVDSVNFVDKSIQNLAEWLTQEIDIELVRREDSTMRDIDINMARLLSTFGGRLSEGQEFHQLSIDRLFKTKQQVQEFTYAFFMDMVNRAEDGSLQAAIFSDAYRDYCRDLRRRLDELDDVFSEVLQQTRNMLEQGRELESVGCAA